MRHCGSACVGVAVVGVSQDSAYDFLCVLFVVLVRVIVFALRNSFKIPHPISARYNMYSFNQI